MSVITNNNISNVYRNYVEESSKPKLKDDLDNNQKLLELFNYLDRVIQFNLNASSLNLISAKEQEKLENEGINLKFFSNPGYNINKLRFKEGEIPEDIQKHIQTNDQFYKNIADKALFQAKLHQHFYNGTHHFVSNTKKFIQDGIKANGFNGFTDKYETIESLLVEGNIFSRNDYFEALEARIKANPHDLESQYSYIDAILSTKWGEDDFEYITPENFKTLETIFNNLSTHQDSDIPGLAPKEQKALLRALTEVTGENYLLNNSPPYDLTLITNFFPPSMGSRYNNYFERTLQESFSPRLGKPEHKNELSYLFDIYRSIENPSNLQKPLLEKYAKN